MTAKRLTVKCPECPEQCFCGSTKDMEQNHLGGQNHIPWFAYPFCKKDHATFHVMCKRAGIDFRFKTNKSLRLIQAMKAMLVGIWMALEMLEEHLESQLEDQS